ncbi:dipeptide epimerase, partial [Parvibaculum sp.]|uniref:dipeptide epimerase n=1 Tax=Parvibaculum sp. TaxID=2024848 RepID=UPI002B61B734
GETQESVLAQIEAVAPKLAGRFAREELEKVLPAGAARNALDCALWDLEAKQSGVAAEVRAMVAPTAPIVTAYTITIKTPEEMAEVARKESHRQLLKIKLGHFEDDRARMEHVRRAAPDARLIVDANEGWTFDQLKEMVPILEGAGVELIEQPLHATRDDPLRGFECGIPLCADEACHTRASLPSVEGKYAYINIKLDKTGGVTEALALAREARKRGFGVMIGCTNGTTLAMAPGLIVAQLCSICDLDAAMFLREVESGETVYAGSELDWSSARRWGLP